MTARVFWLKHRLAIDWIYMIVCVAGLWIFLSYTDAPPELYSSYDYELALAGDRSAQRRVGLKLLAGQKNLKEAEIWLERAARKGDPAAQYNLGLILYADKEGRRDIKTARRWLLLSAQSGYEPARTILQKLNHQQRRQDASQIIESQINEIRENLHLLSQ